jgi:opacity protein-like surface antigen
METSMSKNARLSSLSIMVLSTSLALALASASAVAGNDYKGDYSTEQYSSALTLKDGFYVGAQLGYDSYRFNSNNSAVLLGVPESVNITSNATGFVGGILGGYGMYFNSLYYVGAEMFFNNSGANQSSNASIGSLNYTEKTAAGFGYGISLLPGLKVSNTALLYLRLGYNGTYLQANERASTSTASIYSGNNWNWQSGFNYGLGLEAAVHQNLSLRTELSHTDYNSINDSFSTSFNPSNNQLMFSIIYHAD